jgi:hypothetical protein
MADTVWGWILLGACVLGMAANGHFALQGHLANVIVLALLAAATGVLFVSLRSSRP